MLSKTLVAAALVSLALASAALADPYQLAGTWVEVDYWAGTGDQETILVVDWNGTNGPYETESHAFGYRWSGAGMLDQAVTDICAAGLLDITTSSGGAFISDAYYYDAGIDGDDHTSAGYTGWWWLGSTIDGGATWVPNVGGITTEPLEDGAIEGMNLDGSNWTSATLTIPVPEPGALLLLSTGVLVLRRRR